LAGQTSEPKPNYTFVSGKNKCYGSKSAGAVANSAENTMMKKRQGCLEYNSAYTLI